MSGATLSHSQKKGVHARGFEKKNPPPHPVKKKVPPHPEGKPPVFGTGKKQTKKMALVPFAGDMGLTGSLSLMGPGAASGMLSTAASNKRHVEENVIDAALANQIFKFYYEEEPLIGVCKDQRFALTFVGEMHIEWGGGDIDPIRLDSPAERDQFDTLFKRALEYRDMFGMVPTKLSRRAPRKRNNKPMVVIPPFGSGNFIMRYDTEKMETTVVYRVGTEATVKKRGSAQRSKKQVAKDYEVFVWPGYEPSRVTKRFRSRVASLHGRYTGMVELRANMHDADFRASHPVVFTQARPDTRSLQEMTEEEMLGLVEDGAPGTEESRRYQRDVHRAMQTEEIAAQINGAARAPLNSLEGPTSGAPIRRAAFDPASRRVVQGERTRTWDGAIQPLPVGEEMARLVQPQSRTDLIAFEARYEDLVCKTMGIPAAYISGTVGSQRMRGEADQLRNNVRASVLQDRSDINLFYTWAYEKTHRSVDDDMMVHALLAADEKDHANPSPDEKKRVAKIRANISKISTMPYRTRVVFSEDPLPKKIELPMLTAAVNAGALTKLELVNLIRAEIGVPGIDETHELVREADAHGTASVEIVPSAAKEQQQPQREPEAASPPPPRSDGKEKAPEEDTAKDGSASVKRKAPDKDGTEPKKKKGGHPTKRKRGDNDE